MSENKLKTDIMKIKQLSFCFMLFLLFSGCAQMNIDDSDAVRPNTVQDLRIAPGDTPITADEAMNVAQLFMVRKSPATKVTSLKRIESVLIFLG